MEWDTYMKTLTDHQEYLENVQMVCQKWGKGERDEQVRASEIGQLMTQLERNSHHTYYTCRLVEVVLSRQVEFNKAVIAMLIDLDYRKKE